jgi:hypothetical protein
MENIPEIQTTRDFEMYQRGYESKAAKFHAKPSPQTLELFKKMDDKIDKIFDAIGSIHVELAKIPERIFDKADDRYAAKEIEKKLNDLCDERTHRDFDWLKILISIVISVAGTIAVLFMTHMLK